LVGIQVHPVLAVRAQAFQEIGFLNPIAEEHLHPALGAVGLHWQDLLWALQAASFGPH
jgi:hypothetical protein